MSPSHDPAATRRARARAALDLGRHEAAAREARAVLASAPDDVDAMRLLARALDGAGDGPAACAAAERAMALEPSHAESHHLLAWLLYRAEAPLRAVPFAERAVTLAPGRGELHAMLATLYAAIGRHADARICAQHAATLAPDAPDVLSELSYVYERCGEPDRAEALARRALAVRGDAAGLVRLASILRGQGRALEAVEAAEAAIRLEPNSAPAWEALGHAQQRVGPMGRGAEALAESDRLLRHAARSRAPGARAPRVPLRVSRGILWAGVVAMFAALAMVLVHALLVALGVVPRDGRVIDLAGAVLLGGIAWLVVATGMLVSINLALARWWSARGPRSRHTAGPTAPR